MLIVEKEWVCISLKDETFKRWNAGTKILLRKIFYASKTRKIFGSVCLWRYWWYYHDICCCRRCNLMKPWYPRYYYFMICKYHCWWYFYVLRQLSFDTGWWRRIYAWTWAHEAWTISSLENCISYFFCIYLDGIYAYAYLCFTISWAPYFTRTCFFLVINDYFTHIYCYMRD